MSTPLIALKDISLSLGRGPLFSGLAVALGRGDAVCLVGRNGCGKSTLMKLLSGQIEPDSGMRFVQPGTRIAYLPQDAGLPASGTIADHVAGGLVDAARPDRADHRVAAVLSRLDLDGERGLAGLSGGEARRVSLARALVDDPDVLLLDEPTNHLDLPRIEWLEGFCAAYAGALLVISHDRAFLAKVSRRTLWLDRGRVRVLDRGYDAFEAWSTGILEDETAALARLDQKIAAESLWLGRSITARRSRNEGRKQRLVELRQSRTAVLNAGTRVKLAAEAGGSRSRLVIEAIDVVKSFPPARPVIDGFSTRIMRGDRIGIVGPNGAGKTTLVRLLTGDLAPDRGRVRLAKAVTPAYFDQRRATLDPARTLMQTLCPKGGDQVMVRGQPRHVYGYLRDFLFDDRQATSLVGGLSGGERNRLLLAVILAQPSNLLVLDEPTNDLDMDTLDLLQEALSDYDGTMLIVSHDRDFLDRLVNGTFLMPGDGRVRDYAGGYTDMLAQRRDEPGAPERKPVAKADRAARPSIVTPRADSAPTRLSYNDMRTLAQLPDRIATLSEERARLELLLADPTLYGRDRAAFETASVRLDEIRRALDEAEERWLALELRREALAAKP